MDELTFTHRYLPGESARTLLLLHGTGGDENDLLPLGRELDPTAGLLSVRGQVLENGMPRFFRRLAEGVFDLEDLRHRANELADFIVAASAHYGFARENLVAVGYSNGANIAAAIFLLRPEVLRRAILFRAMVPLVPTTLPDLAGAQLLLSAGKHDPIIEPAETGRLVALLQTAGAETTTEFLDAGHGLVPADLALAKRWLATR